MFLNTMNTNKPRWRVKYFGWSLKYILGIYMHIGLAYQAGKDWTPTSKLKPKYPQLIPINVNRLSSRRGRTIFSLSCSYSKDFLTYDAWTLFQMCHVRVWHVLDTETCWTRVKHGSVVSHFGFEHTYDTVHFGLGHISDMDRFKIS